MIRRIGLVRLELKVENVKKTKKRVQSFQVVARRQKTPRRIVGHLEVEIEDNGRAYVSHVRIQAGFQDKGLGKALYCFAISHYGELNTRFEDASTSAQRVWLSLIHSGMYRYDWQEGTYLCLWPKGKHRRSKCSGKSLS
jgi:ribosomal protein S18 acetylase RimI-like enzyme